MGTFGNTFGLMGAGERSGGIPFQNDALLWLDGTILNSAGTYYAVDRRNGYLFPLSGIPNWNTALKIFPFNSNIRISAPANGTDAATAIQAIDVDNFFYASDGTANVLPINCFAPNINFQNKCFSRPVTRTVDANLVELTPAGIKDIVLYNSALTDLTEATTFYGADIVPVAGAKYIDGNTTESAGTRTGAIDHPWKGIIEAEAAITTGHVYIKGDVSETASIIVSKVVTYEGMSKVTVKSTATTSGVIRAGNNDNVRKFKRLIFDAQNANQWLGLGAGSPITLSNITFENCDFINMQSTTIGIGSTVAMTSADNKLINCTIDNSAATRMVILGLSEVSGCLFQGQPTSNYFQMKQYTDFKYNKVNATILSGKYFITTPLSISSNYNHITNLGVGSIVSDATASANQSKFNYNIVRQVDADGVVGQLIRLTGSNSQAIGNDILMSGTNATGNYNKATIIYISGSTTPTVTDNLIDVASANVAGIIEIYSGGVTCGASKQNRNRILVRAGVNASMIVLDLEKTAAEHHKFDGFEINDNVIYAPYYYGGGFGTAHTIFAWANDGEMRRNYINGSYDTVIMKGAGTAVDCLIEGNKFINCVNGTVIKGLSGVESANNINDTELAVSSPGVILQANGAEVCHDSNVHHNTFINRGSHANTVLWWAVEDDSLTGATIDYNNYYTTQAKIALKTATRLSLSESRALGYDLHSTLLTEAPAFDDSEF